MKAIIDRTMDDVLGNSIQQLEDVYVVHLVTGDGSEYAISEDRQTGRLRVSVSLSPLQVFPRAANVIHLKEEGN